MPKELTQEHVFDRLLFDLNNSMLNADTYMPTVRLRAIVTHLAERVARLEQQVLPHITVGPSVADLMRIDAQLRKANADKLKAIVAQSFNQGTVPEKTTVKAGYVPDDFRS